MPKLNYGQNCNDSNQCLDSELTFCNLSTICVCSSEKYFDTIQEMCKDKIGEHKKCYSNMTDMCQGDMFCKNNDICTCEEEYFFENTTSKCVNQFLYNETCNRDFECGMSRGLKCIDNYCLCNDTTKTWSAKSKECKFTFNSQGCDNDTDCNEDENLFCMEENYNCSKSNEGKVCACKKEFDNENYWNNFKCVKAKYYGQFCSNNCQCQTITQNTKCNNFTCECTENQKFLKNIIRDYDSSISFCKIRNSSLATIFNFTLFNFFNGLNLNGSYWLHKKETNFHYDPIVLYYPDNSQPCPSWVPNSSIITFENCKAKSFTQPLCSRYIF